MKQLIGSYKSATGESGLWFTRPFALFSCRQTKTIHQQLEMGVTYFEFHINEVCGRWRVQHGLWVSELPVTRFLDAIEGVSRRSPYRYFVNITANRMLDNAEFRQFMADCEKCYPDIIFVNRKEMPIRRELCYRHSALPLLSYWLHPNCQHEFNDLVYLIGDFV